MHRDDSGHSCDQERPESTNPSVPQEPEKRREDEARDEGDCDVVAVLPHDEWILSQILDVLQVARGLVLEHDPAYVGVKESVVDVVRIFVVIDVFVVVPMIGTPAKSGVFKGSGSEDQGRKLHRPLCFKAEVREKSVVTERDAQSGGDEEGHEEGHLEPVETVGPNISRHSRQRQESGAGEEDTVGQTDGLRCGLRHNLRFYFVFFKFLLSLVRKIAP